MPIPSLALGITSGISALGNWLANRKSSRTSTSDTTQKFDFSDTPTSSEGYGQYRDTLLSRLLARINEEPELPQMDFSGLRAGGTEAINRGSEIARNALSSRLAERGLSYSPGVGASSFGALETGRGNEIANLINSLSFKESEFKSNLPLLREEMIRKRLSDMLSASPLFMGNRRTGTSTGSGTNVGPGSPFGAALMGGANTFATGLGFRSDGGGDILRSRRNYSI